MDLQSKIRQVREILRDKKVIVAFSGGADSSLVASIAMEVGRRAVAVTIDTGILPPGCVENAKRVAAGIGIPHHVYSVDILQNKGFRENPPHRCLICKDMMYSILGSMAKDEGFDIVADGTNITDMLEDRPGIIANYKRKVVSPLLSAKMSHDEVLEYLKREKINHSVNTTCLATRIKGPITLKKLRMVSSAENIIKGFTGLEVVRVRELEENAIIEVEDIKKLLDTALLKQIEAEFKNVGFKRVYLDIGGYYRGETRILKKFEGDKTIFELDLPYPIDIEKTCKEFRGDFKCPQGTGILMVKIKNVTVELSKDGKITFKGVEGWSEAEEVLVDILASVRRSEEI